MARTQQREEQPQPSQEEMVKLFMAQMEASGVLEAFREKLRADMQSDMSAQMGAFTDAMKEFDPVKLISTERSDGDTLEAGPSGHPYIYWKRRDGRPILGPTQAEFYQYSLNMRKGYTPMPQYCVIPSPSATWPCCTGVQVRNSP